MRQWLQFSVGKKVARGVLFPLLHFHLTTSPYSWTTVQSNSDSVSTSSLSTNKIRCWEGDKLLAGVPFTLCDCSSCPISTLTPLKLMRPEQRRAEERKYYHGLCVCLCLCVRGKRLLTLLLDSKSPQKKNIIWGLVASIKNNCFSPVLMADSKKTLCVCVYLMLSVRAWVVRTLHNKISPEEDYFEVD